MQVLLLELQTDTAKEKQAVTTSNQTKGETTMRGTGTATTQSIEIVSVSGGKFHRPENQSFNGGGNDIRNARLMRCGRSLVPLNFFETIADADRHTGGRLERYICQQCEKKVSYRWRVPEILKNGIPSTTVKHFVYDDGRPCCGEATEQRHQYTWLSNEPSVSCLRETGGRRCP